jgi:hypothetical protein
VTHRVRCPKCRAYQPLVLDTDLHGHVVDLTPECPCIVRKRAGLCRTCPNRVQGRAVYCPPCAEIRKAETTRRLRGIEKPRVTAVKVDKARRRACICQRCDLPTVGRPKVALYCTEHKRAAHKESQRRHHEARGAEHSRRWREKNRAKARRMAREYARKNRQRRNDYKREWRARNRDKVRAAKRRWALRGKLAEAQRRHRQRARENGHVPMPAPRNEHGERLCLRDGCTEVVTGRRKLCDTCRVTPLERAA